MATPARITSTTLEQTPAERQGQTSGALQRARTLATAVVAGLGSAALAIANHSDFTTLAALAGHFAFTALLALYGVLLSGSVNRAV